MAFTEPASFLINGAGALALREVVSNIARNGYAEMVVRERLGLDELSDLHWRALPIYRAERLSARDPLDLAIDLFLLQGTLLRAELDRLFTSTQQDLLVGVGLLAIDEAGSARARASMFPVGDRLIFSDHAWPELPHPGYTIVPYDHVMYIGADSRELARCTLGQPIQAALDLCTGSGIQALLASTHSQRVFAVDINERAARCARFNAEVAAINNLEISVGDLFEPFHEKRFDLITANPPFVPSPVDTLGFRDGGRSGEDVQKRIVNGLPLHLAPGGTAQMTTELGERDGEPLVNRLREWLGGAPMDIHILRLREYSAARYAIAHAKGDDFATFLESVAAWANNLRAHGYVRVVAILVSFQWSDPASGPPWDRLYESPPPRRTAWKEIEAAFRAERMARRPDIQQTLKDRVLRRTGPIALFDSRVLGSQIPRNAKATLLGQALTIEQHLDSLERVILGRIEHQVAVAELLQTVGNLKISEEQILAAITSLLRRQLVSLAA